MTTRTTCQLLVLGLAVTFAGCSSDGGPEPLPPPATDAAPIACDPLAPKPITVGAIVGIGRDAAGTLYVDAANGVFVSGGDELERQHVTGTGQSGANEYLFSFEPPGDPSRAQTLLVETDATGAARAMALGVPNSKAFLDEKDSGATALVLDDPASIAGLDVVNTPNEISYVGDVADGTVVLATVPMNRDETSNDGGLSIFYGAPGDVQERQITAFEQSLSNVGTVTFLVGSDSYVLAFGTVRSDTNPLGDFTLKTLTPGTGAPLAVTLRSPTPSELPPELSFRCLP